jgi:hypothetical protein
MSIRNIIFLIICIFVGRLLCSCTRKKLVVFLHNSKILPNRSDVHPPAPTSRGAIVRCYKCGRTKDI